MLQTGERVFAIGGHSAVLEPPELLVIVFRGPILTADVKAYADARSSLLGGLPYLLTLIDLRHLTGLEPEARRPIASIRDPRPQATAFVGGSFTFRVVAEMLANATRLFSKRNLTARFFAEEQPARAWLAERRAALRSHNEDVPF